MKNQAHYNTARYISSEREQKSDGTESHDKEIILVEFWWILEEFWLNNNIWMLHFNLK